jgi:hypothetical protein
MSIEILPLLTGVTFVAVWGLVVNVLVQARRKT